MNTIKFIRLPLMALSMLVLTASCSESQTSDQQSTTGENQETLSTSATPEQVQATLRQYLSIKNALVQTDGREAGAAGKALATSLADTDDPLLNAIAANAKSIGGTIDVETQRKAFNDLSENMYQLVKTTGGNTQTVYKQYCPMAFNNTGAFWLAAEEEVNNPYFGDMMLHCGSVQEEL